MIGAKNLDQYSQLCLCPGSLLPFDGFITVWLLFMV